MTLEKETNKDLTDSVQNMSGGEEPEHLYCSKSRVALALDYWYDTMIPNIICLCDCVYFLNQHIQSN